MRGESRRKGPDALPRVSIITPFYNHRQFILGTILSVKNRDYPNIEHIIVDEWLADNTVKISVTSLNQTGEVQWPV